MVPLIVGETEAAATSTCDEVAAYGGGALVRQDMQLPYTALQAALDDLMPYGANYWDKGMFIDWDPSDSNSVSNIVDTVIQHWDEKPDFASKLSTFLLCMEVNGAVGKADPESTSFAARGGRLWCTAIISWSDDDDSKRAASKTWCDDFHPKTEPVSCNHLSEQRHARERFGDAWCVSRSHHEPPASTQSKARPRQRIQDRCVAV